MKPCTRCRERDRRPGQRWCLVCHAEYIRKTRPKYGDLTAEQKFKADARTRMHVYRKRGYIRPRPLDCEGCGDRSVLQGHHTDYTRPLEVIYLCKPCHKEADKAQKVPRRAILPDDDSRTSVLLDVDSGEEYFQICSFPVIQPPVPVILTLNDGTVGQPYSYQFTYTGGCQ